MINYTKLKKVVNVFSLTGKYLQLAKKNESNVVDVKSRWAADMVRHFNIKVQIIGQPVSENEACVFVGNHISYLDIPILVHSRPDISFVSKKEVQRWPIIGTAATKAQTIFLERDRLSSRASTRAAISHSLLSKRQKVVIFPSGTTSIHTTSHWKKGAFEIAQANNIKIQPFRISYKPLRDSAYIDQDNFLLHMYNLFSLNKIEAYIEFHEPIYVKDSLAECNTWKQWCEECHLK